MTPNRSATINAKEVPPLRSLGGLPWVLPPRQCRALILLEERSGRPVSWCRDHGGMFVVDLHGDEEVDRFQGEDLDLAISAAMKGHGDHE